ncbi:MAG: anaerobic ribonucleoside-triphosphate reductase activating protein [Candidatus Omnitrophica bacterium]|nr:anaerobic ribonucleoside-triphosphate reductase activating protein [Candidatus Omnitrophota bacterium]
MKIGGLIKFSLIDFPGKIAAVIFVQGCNFRCPYCHNPELVDPKSYSALIHEEEVLDFLNKRRGQLGGVVITGGEPTLQLDLLPFSLNVKNMGYALKLDTNGSRPEVIQALIDQNVLDYIAMDIKAPFVKYFDVAGVDNFADNVKQSIEIIKDSALDYEFRTTFIPGLMTENDIVEIAEMIKGAKRYKLQLFNVDKKNILDDNLRGNAPSQEEIKQFEIIKKKYEKDFK